MFNPLSYITPILSDSFFLFRLTHGLICMMDYLMQAFTGLRVKPDLNAGLDKTGITKH